MAEVYIHELPEIDETGLKPTDIMVVENEKDTYHIQLSALQSIFSCDNKIDAIYGNILDRLQQILESQGDFNNNINNIINNHTTQISSLIETVNSLTERVVKLEHNTTILTQDVRNLESRVDNVEVRLTNIDTSIDSINIKIESIETDLEDIKRRLNEVENINNNQDISITDIYEKLKTLKDLIDSYNGLSEETLRETETELRELITDKYEELLKIIDECHHQVPIIE